MIPSSSPANPLSRGRAACFGLCLVLLGLLLIPAGSAQAADVTPPTGSIGRPASMEAGIPAIFTANVIDEVGGSGIDPNGYSWSATGFEPRTGVSTTYTFPAPGRYEVTLTYRDLAGNSSTLTVTANVVGDQSVLPAAGILAPTTTVKRTKDKKSLLVTVTGEIAPVIGPKAVTGESLLRSTACTASVTLALRKGTTSVASANAQLVRKSCTYRRTITVSAKKAGTAKTLTLVVRFNANAAMRKTTSTPFTVKLPKLPVAKKPPAKAKTKAKTGA